MDSFSLKTASTYVNNLLLARGLGNGKPIEFAKPSKAEGGAEATMAQIINLVHDLLLRRDREQEQRESLVQTIRSLRTQNDRTEVSTERLQTKCDELARQLSLCQSQERAARAALRTAETSARTLREEMLRLKTTVQQVRTSCANDIRKRDVQIQRLKTHLNSQQRGNKTSLIGASITITPGVTGMGMANASREDDAPGLDDPAYSLKQETTEFLTQLSQGLSNENDNLIGLVRGTLATLRHLQGMPENLMAPAESTSSLAGATSHASSEMVQALPSSFETLSADMDSILESLKTLLTSPNFVPIEEVATREEEIVRLRDGFEKLETRWKEAIALMNSWRERMEKDGDTINLEEIKMGLGLGVGFGASVYVNRSGEDSSCLEDIREESSELDELNFDSAAEDDVPAASPDVLHESRKKASDKAHDSLSRTRPGRVLSEADGNGSFPKKVKFSKTNMPTPPDEENVAEMDFADLSPEKQPTILRAGHITVRQTASRLPRKALKRQSSPERQQESGEPELTVQEKLNATQAEAEAAVEERATKTRRVDGGERKTVPRDEPGSSEQPRTEAAKDMPVKRARVTGRPRRRKSTLTRDELADMLLGLI